MPKKLYVGNLPRSLSGPELESLFAVYGEVKSAELITDRMTGVSRGFGFVQMQTQEATRDAMAALDGTDVQGSHLTVSEARERPQGGGRPVTRGRPGSGFGRRSGGYSRSR
jgi:cold-inducible RNA-binding protein